MPRWVPPLLLAACEAEPDVVETIEDDLRHVAATVQADNQGRARLELEVGDGDEKLLATAEAGEGRLVHFVSLVDPDGDEVLAADRWDGADRSRSNGLFLAGTVSLNWPIAPGDARLAPGRWTLELALVEGGAYVPGPIDVDVHLSADGAFDDGHLDVAVVYTGALGDDGGLREAMRAATDQWQEMVAPHGLTLSFTPIQWPQAAPTASPADDVEAAYAEIAAEVGPRTLVLVLVESLVGDALGVAGDVPGPLVPTERSAVVVSFLGTAGPDLDYDAEEIRLLAETLAHEAGHYLGLFHPVEQGWTRWDSLDDTPTCGDKDGCEQGLGGNLMFPYPVCFPEPCVPQTTLTPDQAGVLHRNTAVW